MLKQIFKHKIVKTGMWYTLSNFFLYGITFLTIPIFTRILSPSEYGVVSLYKTWVSILMIIISFSLTESIRRAKYDYEVKYDEFASSIMFLSIIVFSIYFAITIWINKPLQKITGISSGLLYLAIIHAFFVYVKEFYITKLRFEYKYKLASIISILPIVLGIVISIILVKYFFIEDKYLGRIIGESFFIILSGFVFLCYLLLKGKKFIKMEYWKYALSISSPLVIHNLSKIINNQFDRIIINKYLGQSATGIYSLSYSLGTIVTIIAVSLGQAWEPWFFEKFKNDNILIIRKRAKNYRDIFTLIYICVLMASTEVIKIMANKNYWEGITIIPWIFLALYFQFLYSFEVNVEFALKKTKLISVGTILAALVNVVLNILLVPRFGYIAAAITTVISYVLLFLLHYMITFKVIKRKIYGLNFYLISIVYAIISTIYFIIFRNNVIMRWLFIIIAIIVFYKSIAEILNKNIE